MYTVYVNKGDGWVYTKDCELEQEAINICILHASIGYKADYSRPNRVERDIYD